jgi:hypothetical protein
MPPPPLSHRTTAPPSLSQARLPYSRTTPPPCPSTAASQSSQVSRQPSPAPSSTTDLSTLDSSQFQDMLEEANRVSPSRERTLVSMATNHTKSKRKRTAWVYNHMAGSTDVQVVFHNEEGKEV